MINTELQVKVIDFSVSKRFSGGDDLLCNQLDKMMSAEKFTMMTKAGTPLYSAPEMQKGAAYR